MESAIGTPARFITASTGSALASVPQNLSAVQALELLEQDQQVYLLDVRTFQEYQQIRLDGATLIPIDQLLRRIAELPKEQPILVVCAVGGRSYIAGKALRAMGHQEVYNLDGGLEAWRRAQLPLETGPEDRKK